MHKEPRTALACAAIGLFIILFAGFVCFFCASSKSTSATLKVLKFGTNQSGSFVMVQLSNAGPGTITYFGNAPNQPRSTIQVWFSGVILPLSGFARGTNERSFKLEPRRSVDFEVSTLKGWQQCQVMLSYTVRDPFEWFRAYTPYLISRWLPRPPQVERVTSPLIRSNSQLAGIN